MYTEQIRKNKRAIYRLQAKCHKIIIIIVIEHGQTTCISFQLKVRINITRNGNGNYLTVNQHHLTGLTDQIKERSIYLLTYL